MKNFFILLIISISSLLLWNCHSVPQPVYYKVKGKVGGMEQQNAVLYLIDKNLSRQPLDTVVVKDSIFEFAVPKQNPQIALIALDKLLIPVIIGDGDVIINNFPNNPKKVFEADVSASTSALTKKFFDYERYAEKDKMKGIALMQKYRMERDSDKQKLIKEKYEQWRKKAKEYQYDFMKNNKDIVSLIIMQPIINGFDTDFQKIREIFESYPENVKRTNIGKYINTVILTKGATEIGGKAPNFIGTTPEGKKLSLGQAMGKVTIIDFWASWCRPCRMENPYIVEIYNKYHDRGLNIIGVSLDKNKESWLKAIQDDGLKWQHVSELKHWQDPIAKTYGVTAIPQTFILDAKGIIRAKNLRREELEAKIVELLNE